MSTQEPVKPGEEVVDPLRAPGTVVKTVVEEIPVVLEAPVSPAEEPVEPTPAFAEQPAAVVTVEPATVKKITQTVAPVGIEREVFGMWSVMLRNAGGILAAVTTCIIAIVNAYTTYKSVTGGNGWPSETIMFIANVGPIVVAWTFMNSSKTISTIMQVRGVQDRLKNAMSGFVANPNDTNQQRRSTDRPETPPPGPPTPPQY